MSGTRLPIRLLRHELALAIGLGCAVLPASAPAAGNDQIKQLRDQLRKIQKDYQTQIRGLQKQLDDLKAARAAPKAPPTPDGGISSSTASVAHSAATPISRTARSSAAAVWAPSSRSFRSSSTCRLAS